MLRLHLLGIPIAAAAILTGGTALADTRSSSAISAQGKQPAADVRGDPQGPKRGFPDNHGIRNAMEHADDHARFKRNDSEG